MYLHLLIPIQRFQRPDLEPPQFEFTIYDSNAISPGYILMAPYTPDITSNLAAGSSNDDLTNAALEIQAISIVSAETIQNGPYVFDNKGVRVVVLSINNPLI